jgi:hypothetical protein
MSMVAMTREMGSLGKDVATGIAARSGRRVVYHEITAPIAQGSAARRNRPGGALDAPSALADRLMTDDTQVTNGSPGHALRFLRDGSTGVIRGWGALHMLREVPHVVRVRICAPLEIRVRRMMERLATDDFEAVQRMIAASDAANSAVTQHHFGVDWREAEHYDIVLSTERLSVEECTDAVDQVMRQPRFVETPDSRAVMEKVAVEWAVRFALRGDTRTARADITVRSNAGRVLLLGVVATEQEVTAAGAIASAIEGIHGVDNEIGISPGVVSRAPRRT